MKPEKNIDMERICRVCLQENDELFLLFDENYFLNGISISQILSECTIYKVNRHDELPHQICKSCMDAAKNAYSFKKRTEQSYRTLVGLLDKVSQEQLTSGKKSEQSTQTDKLSIYPCEMCDAKFFEPEDLRNHRLNSHRGNNFKCKCCGLKFKRLYRLRGHIALQHPEEGLSHDTKCTVCGKQFSRKDHMRRHMKNVHGKDATTVERCNNLTLEEPEINLQPVNDSLQQTEGIIHENHFERNQAIWEGYSTKDSESDNDDGGDHNATNPISSDSHDDDEDEKPLSLLSITEKPLKVEPMDEEEMQIISEPLFLKCESDSDTFSKVCDINIPEEFQVVNEAIQITEKPIVIEEKKTKEKTTIVREYLGEKSNKRSRSSIKYKDNRCPECQRVFSRHCHLQRHMLTHTLEKPHECSHCLKRFTRRDHLKNHMESQHGDKIYKCDQCDNAFPRNEALLRHKASKHSDGINLNKVHKCDLCEKSFVSRAYLVKHRLLHTDRVYACKQCDETFKQRGLLREHEKTHNAPRNYLCSICGESFARNDYLRVHMRRHTGEKPYKCKYCDKGFPRATDLNVHVRYHTGHKPNLCTLCGKGFHRAYNLTIHMRTHTGERPFQCEHCSKSFAQSNDLKAHVRRHTGERFKCNNCDASFLQLYGLRQHALAAHGVVIDTITGRLQKFPKLEGSHEEFMNLIPEEFRNPTEEQLLQQQQLLHEQQQLLLQQQPMQQEQQQQNQP